MKKLVFLTFLISLIFPCLYADERGDLENVESITKSNIPAPVNKSEQTPQSENKQPNMVHQKSLNSKKGPFFQANIGAGFLYFSGIKGSTYVKYADPLTSATQQPLQGEIAFTGPIRYNRTPLFEFILGYEWTRWLKGALSYQHQGGISVQTPMQRNSHTVAQTTNVGAWSQLRSDLSLDAIMFKFVFDAPQIKLNKNMVMKPYLGLGVGPSWQSWTNVSMQQSVVEDRVFSNVPVPLRNKYVANAAFMVDVGIKFNNLNPNKDFSVVLGCKYNEWGQACNIGKISQQGAPDTGLPFPFSVKILYSFAPYLGVQWNFSNNSNVNAPIKICNKNTDRWTPFVANTRYIEQKSSIFTQFNVGAGFLYFSGVNGNIYVRYSEPGAPPNQVTVNQGAIYGTSSFKGSIGYNRTPLFEYLLGYQWTPWIKGALSYQHQGGISVQTAMESGLARNYSLKAAYAPHSQLRSNLSLDAIMAKIYLELPYALICKGVCTSPYLAIGVGPGWQSWTDVELEQTVTFVDSSGRPFISSPLPLRSKYSASAAWMVDVGFHLQNANPNSQFSVFAGCKYNSWGKSGNIGEISEQNEPKRGLVDPFNITMLYSFAPYLGVQWNFSNSYSVNVPVTISGKNINRWKPFIANTRYLEQKPAVFTQFNAGVGFLYFSGINGSTAIEDATPAQTAFANGVWGQSPYKGSMRYNRTPLFEYLLGYRLNSWFKCALSYQHQGGISVQSAMEYGIGSIPTTASNLNPWLQLRANLSLDALMAKAYFELPFAFICKAVATAPYLAAGVGPGWQSWTDIQLEATYVNARRFVFNDPLPLRNKYSANAVWMLDAGFHLQSAYPNSPFSVLIGCKYVQWGQSGNIGKVSQQNEPKRGLRNPFRVKMLYSFAPYLGIEWSF